MWRADARREPARAQALTQTRRRAKTLRAPASNESGAAMVMALTVIFVLSALGAIALLFTLTNARMASKVGRWTQEYYEMDSAAEAGVQELDGLLAQAEGYAYAYMRDERFREAEGAPAVTGDARTELTEKGQNFLYNKWQGEVYAPAVTAGEGGVELLDEDRYDSLFEAFNGEAFERLYYYYAYRLILARVQANNGASATSGASGASAILSVQVSPEMAGFAGMLDGYRADEENGIVVTLAASANTATASTASTASTDTATSASGSSSGSASTASIGVTALVLAPKYSLGVRDENVPLRANPVWTNALLAEGNISFTGAGGRARVYGDIVSRDIGEYYPEQNAYASPEGNRNGVMSAGAKVDIYGNVYSRGDVHVTRSGGEIVVRRYPEGFGVSYKADAFGNTLFFDTSTLPAMVQRYTQAEDGAWERAFLPFFYRDHLGGNVYCNGLIIEEGVNEATIRVENGPTGGVGSSGASSATLLATGTAARLSNVGAGAEARAGVVWTLDDVQNNGRNSTIAIEGNLIGISSETNFSDHLSSSAVINGYPQDSKIALSGGVVMPGTGYLKFNGVNDMESEDAYYETAESVTGASDAILRAYMQKPAYATDSLYYFDHYILRTARGVSDFFLVNYDVIGDKVRHLAGNLSGRVPKTGVVVEDALWGYARGAVVASTQGGASLVFGLPSVSSNGDYVEMRNYAENYLAYSEVRDALKTAFSVKTESFGTKGYGLSDLVDLAQVTGLDGAVFEELESAITVFYGDAELDLASDRAGIVYCALAAGSDKTPTLTIIGDGTFRGTIICEGDIVVAGNPVIRYDEALIAKSILFYPGIQACFRPGEMGGTSYVRVVSVAQSREKTRKDRYRLLSWMETQA